MKIEQILTSGIINRADLAARMWPEKSKANAASRLHVKLFKSGGNKMSQENLKRALGVLKEAGVCLDITDAEIKKEIEAAKVGRVYTSKV